MRQSEFRGLRTDGKGWICGDLLHNHWTGGDTFTPCAIRYLIGDLYSHPIEVRPETVGQISFSQDVFGYAIYQGHIVIDPLTKMISVVKYGFCKKLGFNGWFLENEHMNYVSALTEQDLEIIGNIHESPELINK